ncbi:WG repeat-containing protein [Formosa sp. L2A11]|uniref:WG repeat-containing protein n=1 Tax=Formosa sp. L2A11 TaxID=2686363 RepID=UPI00131ECCBD|nr:WG repeat-containing protein [Formosa sp. L2A11]
MKNRILLITLLLLSFSCISQTKLFYDELGDFSNGYAIVKNGSKVSFIDSLGQNIDIGDFKLKKESGSRYVKMQKNGFYVIQEDYKNEGVKNVAGEVVIEPKDNKIIVKNDLFLKLDSRDSWALKKGEKLETEVINEKGEAVFTLPGNYKFAINPISNNIMAISNLKSPVLYKLVFLDTKEETEYIYNEVVKPDDDGLIRATKFIESEGKNKWGFIDEKGKIVIDFNYTNAPGPFNNGLAVVQSTDKKFGYIDKANNVAIDVEYINAYNFENNRAVVRIYVIKSVDGKINNGYRVIDNTGKILYDLGAFKPYSVPSDYYNHSLIEGGTIMVLTSPNSLNKSILNLDTGEITKTDFTYIGKFNSGLARVRLRDENKKYIYGYINTKGELVMVQAKKSQF